MLTSHEVSFVILTSSSSLSTDVWVSKVRFDLIGCLGCSRW